MTCKVYKSESAKILENIGCLRFVKNKMKPKTKLTVMHTLFYCEGGILNGLYIFDYRLTESCSIKHVWIDSVIL